MPEVYAVPDLPPRFCRRGSLSEKPSRRSSRRRLATVRGSRSLLTLCAVLPGFVTLKAGPVNLPPVNLGQTSFEDGVAYPGWLLEETFDYYHAGQFNDSDGARLPGQNKLTTVSAITHLAYISAYKLFGGCVGGELLLPLVDAELDASFAPESHDQGVGDLIVSPFLLQWNDRKLFGKPLFLRLDLQMVFPTGKYDASRALNIGNNVVSVNPDYSFTIFPSRKLEVSARLHYLWNSENDRPYCHRSLQNQPRRVESKPATSRCLIHTVLLDSSKGLFN
jgi:hypothetical protein